MRLVEDNPELVMLIEHTFQDTDIDLVVTDHDFERLLEREPWYGIDVAVVDVLLGNPDLDGRDVLRWLKNERPDIRRVCFSAVGNVYTELADLADVVLTKGAVSRSSLLAAIGATDVN